MKHLLSGVAIVAALTIAVPASAQRTSGGRAVPADNSANQLNADELARVQAGKYSNPTPSALPDSKPSTGRQQRREMQR
jgi:hypothetical protein